MKKQNIVPLSSKNHHLLTYAPVSNYAFAADLVTIPLLPFEVNQASNFFTIIFPDPKRIFPHALLGLGEKNIFVDEKNQWKAPYVPVLISNYPFSLIEARFTEQAENSEKKFDLAIGIVEDAPQFHQANGERLFNDNGEATDLLHRIETVIFNQFKRQIVMNQAFKELNQHNVFTDKIISTQYNKKKRSISGLRYVDREIIFSLPDETLGRWVKNGLMEILFSHWQSFRHLPILLDHPSCKLLSSSTEKE